MIQIKHFLAFILFLCSFYPFLLQAQLSVSSTANEKEAIELIRKTLIGNGILVGDMNLQWCNGSMAHFNLNTRQDLVKEGIVLSTGDVQLMLPPNDTTSVSHAQQQPGDQDLSKLIGRLTGDAVSIEFDFIPLTDTLAFNYFFASEEYPEYVGKGFNDAFAFFISGPGYPLKHNMAEVSINQKRVPITIDNINFINNSHLFISNHLPEDVKKLSKNWRKLLPEPLMLNEIEFDGMTKRLMAVVRVVPFEIYTLKIVIADVGDLLYDSAVFLEKESFGASPNAYIPKELDIVQLVKLFEKKYKAYPEKVQELYKRYPEAAFYTQTKIDTFYHSIYYETDEFELSTEQKNQLKKWAEQMQQYKIVHTTITGHTDNEGSYDYNLVLSKKRAGEVLQQLNDCGIKAQLLHWKADKQPVGQNTSEAGKSINRRTEIMIITERTIKLRR